MTVTGAELSHILFLNVIVIYLCIYVFYALSLFSLSMYELWQTNVPIWGFMTHIFTFLLTLTSFLPGNTNIRAAGRGGACYSKQI